MATVLCSTGALAVLTHEQHYEIDGFDARLAVVLFVPVRETSSLRLQSLDQGAYERGYSKVAIGREVILHWWLSAPPKAWIIFSFP